MSRLQSWLVEMALLFLVLASALAVRLVTFDLFSASISTDEYRYAVQTEEWLRRISALTLSMGDFVVLYPLVPVIGGLASIVLGLEPLLAGRAAQLSMSALLAPLAYLLARSGRLGRGASFCSGMLMGLVPGAWDIAPLFLPDSQAAALSTGVLIGALRAAQGHPLGWTLAGIALGLAFLSKPHSPFVLAPTLACIMALWVVWRRVTRHDLTIALIGLTLPLAAAVAITLAGAGMPRSYFLSPTRESRHLVAEDGLPASLPEQSGARPLQNYEGMLQPSPRIAWFGDALGVRAVSGAVTVFVLAGAAAMLRWPCGSGTQRALMWLSSASLGAFALAQIAVGAATDALVAGVALAGLMLLLRAQCWSPGPPPSDSAGLWLGAIAPTMLFVSVALLCATTIGFFGLSQPYVSITARQFATIMPALAVVAGMGLWGAAQALSGWALGVRFGLATALLVAGVAVAAPGDVIRRLALMAVSPLIGLLAQLLVNRRPSLRAPILGIGLLGLAIISGTPTLNTLARARAFQGYPNDPHFRDVSGGVRVAAFREAAPWLRATIAPADVVLTSKAYQVAYYSGLGWAGFKVMRIWDETAALRHPYLIDATLQTARYDWIVDFNQFVVQPSSDEAAAFAADYEWLASRPYLQPELVLRDDAGRLVFYALRRQG